ncbi:TPR domain-containing protein [Rutstroemia sp. NJR-2017a BBW]|nr:TPR domain-containing protein [Rutstroemia sp. NJR-2017a BBW]
MSDIEEAISLHQEALYLKSGRLLTRIKAGEIAAKTLIVFERWHDAAKVLKVAVDLLPLVTLRSNSREDLQYTIQSLSGLTSFTASVFLKAGKSSAQALSILEKGRGIIASPTIDLRSDESQLQAKYPELWSQRLAETYEQTGEKMPNEYRYKGCILSTLAAILDLQYKRTKNLDDLNRAIEAADMAVDATPQDYPDRFTYLSNLGSRLSKRFQQTDSLNDLNRAVEAANIAVNSAPQDDPDRATYLNNLGCYLSMQFERTGSLKDLDRAIEVADIAVNATPEDDPDRAGRLHNLGSHLSTRCKRTGSLNDLDRAVEVADIVVNAIVQDHPNRAIYLYKLGSYLSTRFERTGSLKDLDRAIEVADIAVNATPEDDPDRAGRLHNLGSHLSTRFERTSSLKDLDRAIEVADIAVNATPQDNPNQAGYLNNLGCFLSTRFKRTGSLNDLDRALEVADITVNTAPQDDPYRATYLSNLGSHLGMRFQRMGLIEDLDRAIEAADMAVEATPQDHPNRVSWLNNLGNHLSMRFKRMGLIEDLDRAVESIDIAIAATPQDHPNRAGLLSNLGNHIGMRFERTGSLNDLDRAVEAATIAVDTTPQDHSNRAGYLNNLGTHLDMRFGRTGLLKDLDRAVEAADMAVDATPQDHPDQAGFLNNLGNHLCKRFERTNSLNDLDRAVKAAHMAVDATPQNHPDQARRLHNLGKNLGTRFKRTRSSKDLDRAIEAAEMAVDTTPQEHPERASYLHNLGNLLDLRFMRTGSVEDRQKSISSVRDGWNCTSAPPSTRIYLAIILASYYASQLDWKTSSSILEDAVQLLPIVSPRSLQHTDQQHMLADFAGLASMAAATALNAGKDAYHALKLLEIGRGVIAGLLLEMRTDVSNLERKHPELAKEFVTLRDELDSPASAISSLATLENMTPIESRVKRRREAVEKFREILGKIRSKSKFSNFLYPPTEDEMKTEADPDPIVVINVSFYRCDAFLVQKDCPVKALKLPRLILKDIKENTISLRVANPKMVQKMLEWLWDVAASPILDALCFKQPPSSDDWPHIWWIPTAQLSQLPFHAAGQHFKGSTDTVLDRVMSSYSSSIKALIYGRRHSDTKPQQNASNNALLITVPESGLPFALDEVKMLEDLCPFLGLNPVKPTPRRDEILTHLRTCTIFHFASHGRSNPLEPSESCLVLEGENNSVTVADLRDCRLQENAPFLAYLSACSTKVNEAERLIDEEIHLVSACQLAGFRHVVGTLWEVSDKHCVDVARILYETIKDEGMTDRAVYRGLHRAIRMLRDKEAATTETHKDSYVAGYFKDSLDESIEQKGEEKPDGDDGKPRQSKWGDAGGPSRFAGPLLWASYIHAGQ